MQKDYRDVLEVVKFDLIEETVEAGFGPLVDVWKKSRQLFEGINKSSRPQATKRIRQAESTA